MTSALRSEDAPSAYAVPALSPVMLQYWQMKQANPDSLLFFRMGDFYELFFEDAVVAARDLDIALTKRGKKEGEDIPMCGVPVHTYDVYLAKLIEKGHKVAICEQTENPEMAKKRGAKGPLKREIVRIVTPGTITEDGLLNARQYNFLLALSPITHKVLGVAAIDLSTGLFLLEETDMTHLGSVLARFQPAEIVMPDRLIEEPALYETLQLWKRRLSPLPQARFDLDNSVKRLETLYGVQALEGFGAFSAAQLRAAGTLVDYIHVTQQAALKTLERPRMIGSNTFMAIDPATRKSLEIDRTLSGKRAGSLLDAIDETVTAAGGRLLHLRLSSPLLQPAAIEERLTGVDFFVRQEEARHHIRTLLKMCPDMERALSRIQLSRGGPRDLAQIRDGLAQAEAIKNVLFAAGVASDLPPALHTDVVALGGHLTLIDHLHQALAETLPMYARDGEFIASSYNENLDTFRGLRDNGRELIQELQQKYSVYANIPTLKIRHNNVIGYHIDVTPSYASRVPEDFIHRQTLGSSLRYTTPELGDLEKRIQAAARQALELELELFVTLIESVQHSASAITRTCRALAALDVAAALAELAVTRQYCRPIVDDSRLFILENAHHPVVAKALKNQDNLPFSPNDCHLNEEATLILLTGPNMAGKSTYLRQNALAIIMAQMGSYVPATRAHIGVVDRIFSRVGASDDLASGRSTFMVEMIETAAILNQATDRSFVILDEIGRGTATFDGLSIAWAVVESLCQELRCRGIFATHYHELTPLTAQLPMLRCFTMNIREWEGKLVFLHQVIPGTADKSYGLHVAALAGLPSAVIDRASEVLGTLESQKTGAPPLSVPGRRPPDAYRQLQLLDIDSLSPREALDALYGLKKSFTNYTQHI